MSSSTAIIKHQRFSLALALGGCIRFPAAEPDGHAGRRPSPGFGSDGWFIAAIILIAVALIVGGIWLYTKNRDEY